MQCPQNTPVSRKRKYPDAAEKPCGPSQPGDKAARKLFQKVPKEQVEARAAARAAAATATLSGSEVVPGEEPLSATLIRGKQPAGQAVVDLNLDLLKKHPCPMTGQEPVAGGASILAGSRAVSTSLQLVRDLPQYDAQSAEPLDHKARSRIIGAFIYLLTHDMRRDDVRTYITPPDPEGSQVNHFKHEQYEKMAYRWKQTWQRQMKTCFADCVRETVAIFGGEDDFIKFDEQQRVQIFHAIYKRDPLAVTQKWLGAVGRWVYLEGIFLGEPRADPVRRAWRTRFLRVYAASCKAIIDHLYGHWDDDEGARKWYRAFEKMPDDPFIVLENDAAHFVDISLIPARAAPKTPAGGMK